MSVIEWGIEQTEKVDDALTNSLEYPKDKVRAKEEVKQAKLLIDSVIKSLETGKPYPSLEASTERACRMFQVRIICAYLMKILLTWRLANQND